MLDFRKCSHFYLRWLTKQQVSSCAVWQLIVDFTHIFFIWFVQIKLTSCWQYVTVVCSHTHHRSSTTASFVIFCPIHNSCFDLIDFSPVRSLSPFSGDLCPPKIGRRMAETPKMRLENKTLNFYSGRLSVSQNSLDLSLTWCWRLGTRVLEDPVIGVGGEGEGGWGELLVDLEGEGGRGGHPTTQLPIQLWQGHSPTTPGSSWIFQSHPRGSICLGFKYPYASPTFGIPCADLPFTSWVCAFSAGFVQVFFHISLESLIPHTDTSYGENMPPLRESHCSIWLVVASLLQVLSVFTWFSSIHCPLFKPAFTPFLPPLTV